MRNSAMNPVQRGKLAIAVAIGVGLLSVTGCGFVNAQQTSHKYSASDGINIDLGKLQLRNVAIVSRDDDAPGRVIGAVFNDSSSDATLTIKGANGSRTEVPVKAKSETYLNDSADPAILSTSGAKPGALSSVKISAGSDAKDVNLPVFDGTLPEYVKYLPAEATPSSTPSPTTSESHSTGH